jgi:hypothetical protein
LVSGDERIFSLRQFPFDDVEICPADAAGANPKQKLAGCELRFGSLFNLKRLLRGSENGSFQGLGSEAVGPAFDGVYSLQDTAPPGSGSKTGVRSCSEARAHASVQIHV